MFTIIVYSLNHEYFQVTKTSLLLLASLATYNPAHAMPFLRKLLLQLLTYSEFERVISAYTHGILSVLSKLLNSGDNIKVEMSILSTIDPIAKQVAKKIIDTLFQPTTTNISRYFTHKSRRFK